MAGGRQAATIRRSGEVAGSDATWKQKQHGGDNYQKMAI